MMGPDYTHWHGSYEVAKHFYLKFLPKLESLADKHGDEQLRQLIAQEVFAKPEHAWYDGMDKAEAARIRAVYSRYYDLYAEQRSAKPGAQ